MVERLTVRQAGARLGVSPTTIRRMIAAGELRAEREHRPQGARWIVLLDTETDAPHHAPSRAGGTSLVTNVLVTDLRQRVAFLERLTEHQAGQISELIRRVPELPAAGQPPTPDVPAVVARAESDSVAADRVVAATRTVRRSWWRWWR
jgi:excisionase family DNA binding protein